MGLGECFGEGAEISTRGRVRSPERHSRFALAANLVIVLRRRRYLITSPPQVRTQDGFVRRPKRIRRGEPETAPQGYENRKKVVGYFWPRMDTDFHGWKKLILSISVFIRGQTEFRHELLLRG